MVNKFIVLAKFVFSQALLDLLKLNALVIKSFSGTCDRVCSPLGSKIFDTRQKQRLKMIRYARKA